MIVGMPFSDLLLQSVKEQDTTGCKQRYCEEEKQQKSICFVDNHFLFTRKARSARERKLALLMQPDVM